MGCSGWAVEVYTEERVSAVGGGMTAKEGKKTNGMVVAEDMVVRENWARASEREK